ncbi:DUF5816 domain-containing protein [Haloprofundus salinisoli]|uniref:DUF5816 domain-containing protein n=1 Tax=Haloprofundus salinisoli TaxID=2876193 RepID=UPI001CCDDFDB|nr:DUF5816 domain-containing protein [Haloprofundus salinisoli]
MELEVATTSADDTVYVDRSEGTRGSKAPFYTAYVSESRDIRWGYFCGNCETFDNAMDTMGRIECNACGNIKKPDEWDAAHE